MKKILCLVLLSSMFIIACGGDKKAEAEQKEAELNKEIEAVDQDTDQDIEVLAKEAEEIDQAINELDSL